MLAPISGAGLGETGDFGRESNGVLSMDGCFLS
jgi:hypothetical protein